MKEDTRERGALCCDARLMETHDGCMMYACMKLAAGSMGMLEDGPFWNGDKISPEVSCNPRLTEKILQTPRDCTGG